MRFGALVKTGSETFARSPSLRLLNQDGLTPFTLAAKLGNAKVLHHILKTKMKTTEWNFGSVSLSKMSLEQMDSFRVRSFSYAPNLCSPFFICTMGTLTPLELVARRCADGRCRRSGGAESATW